eukprot:CAMPEP_0172472416 /NCGR_PEP_ID=MMETSP1065-20121228/68322_1 /TAXON_ID=265537 /ORGANISM="Amphiprora paludosa, Strain CCMP125" /LENGTH=1141 /DNA_ID=CAMNT_0013230551 /DNA_START=171 /DNA_END=3596 /DNA_ORIENTATION=-
MDPHEATSAAVMETRRRGESSIPHSISGRRPRDTESNSIPAVPPSHSFETISSSSGEEDDDGAWSDPAGDSIPLEDYEEEEEPAPRREEASKDTPRDMVSKVPLQASGILIPSFLQPLLGLDFVPFLTNKQQMQRSHSSHKVSRHPLNLALLEQEVDSVTSCSSSLKEEVSTASPSSIQDSQSSSNSNSSSSKPEEVRQEMTLETPMSPSQKQEDPTTTLGTQQEEVQEIPIAAQSPTEKEQPELPTDSKSAAPSTTNWKDRRRQRRQQWRGKRFVSSPPRAGESPEPTIDETANISTPVAHNLQKAIATQALQETRERGETVSCDNNDEVHYRKTEPQVVTPVTSKDEDDEEDERRRQRRQQWRGKRFVSSPPRAGESPEPTISNIDETPNISTPVAHNLQKAIAMQGLQETRKRGETENNSCDKNDEGHYRKTEPPVVTPVTSKDEDDEEDEECDEEIRSISIVAQPPPVPETRRRLSRSSSPSTLLTLGGDTADPTLLRRSSVTTAAPRPSQQARRPSLMSTPLGQQVRDMTALRRQAKAVRLRAGNIEERVADLQEHADALFLALQETEARIQEETYMLESTQDELHNVEEKCLTAVQSLQEEIVQARKAQETEQMARTFPTAMQQSPSPRNISSPPSSPQENEKELQDAVIPSTRQTSFLTAATTTATIARTLLASTAASSVSTRRPPSPVPTMRTSLSPTMQKTLSPVPYSSRYTVPLLPRSHSSSSLSSRRSTIASSPSPKQHPKPPLLVFRRARASTADAALKKEELAPTVTNVSSQSHPSSPVSLFATDNSAETRQTIHRSLSVNNIGERRKLKDTKSPVAIVAEPKPSATATALGATFSGNTHIRMNDLDIDLRGWSHASNAMKDAYPENQLSVQDLFLMEDLTDLKIVLKQLAKLGLETVTHESEDRFHPTWETQRIIKQNSACLTEEPVDWSYGPWFEVQGYENVLVWSGSSQHKGFGHDCPLVKARGNIPTSPRKLLDFLLDSNYFTKYKADQTRSDDLVFQSGIDTVDDEVKMEGDARIWRTLEQAKSVGKGGTETICLCHATPLPEGAYMVVSRSVWEQDEEPTTKDVVRSEVLLDVQLLRPLLNDGCELTTITHGFCPGMPQLMAKRMAPGTAAQTIRDIQSVFS